MSRHHKSQNKNCCNDNSGYQPNTSSPANQRLAEATVPYQVYGQIWEPETGLKAGTIFPELYRPYEGR